MKSSIFLLALLLHGPALGQDWTQFRGPGASGVVPAADLPLELSGDAIKWSIDLAGTGHSSPVLWGETIFVTTSGPDAGLRHLLALNAADGSERWRSEQKFTSYSQHRFNDYASATPCVDAQRVYVSWTSPDGVDVLAFDHAGKPVWSKRLGKFYAKHGSAASPVLAGGRLVVGSFGETGKSFISGLDPANGDEKWSLQRESNEKGSYATPVLRRAEDGTDELVFASTAHGLTAVDPANGKVRWEHNPGFTQRCVGGPVISGNHIFLAAGSGGGGKESTVVQIKAGKPEQAWDAGRKGLPYVPTGLARGGLLFLLNDAGMMTCRRASDGDLLWQESVVRPPYASPICVGERIYCFSKDGEVAVVEAGEEFKALAKSKFSEGIYATPAVAGGKMYLRTFEKLYCIGK